MLIYSWRMVNLPGPSKVSQLFLFWGIYLSGEYIFLYISQLGVWFVCLDKVLLCTWGQPCAQFIAEAGLGPAPRRWSCCNGLLCQPAVILLLLALCPLCQSLFGFIVGGKEWGQQDFGSFYCMSLLLGNNVYILDGLREPSKVEEITFFLMKAIKKRRQTLLFLFLGKKLSGTRRQEGNKDAWCLCKISFN